MLSSTQPTRSKASQSPWKPLLVCPHPEMARETRAAFEEAGLEAAHAPEYPASGGLAPLARRHDCNICFLDMETDPEHALALTTELAPVMPVVALNPRNDADMILRCLRKGACEFLAHPSAEAVRGLFERLARARSPQPARPIGAVYCLVPGKAGCGASTLAAHLAVQFASSGARTLLLDADFVTGSIGFMLKLKSDFHLGDVLTDWKRMDDDLWKRLTARCCGVDVVLAPGNPATRVELDKVRAGELAGFWRDRYDAIVIDTPDVRMAAESGLAGLADHILLVTTNELGALHGARRGIEYLDQALPDRGRIRLIVNRYVPALGLKREDLRTALRMEPFAILSNDYESMQAALLEGKPAHSQSRFSNSMLALAKRLRGEPSVEKKQSPWSSFAGLLSRPK